MLVAYQHWVVLHFFRMRGVAAEIDEGYGKRVVLPDNPCCVFLREDL